VQRINAPLLWQLGITGEGVLAAVIDTGVNYHH
jgi:subtilisin family serine protease